MRRSCSGIGRHSCFVREGASSEEKGEEYGVFHDANGLFLVFERIVRDHAAICLTIVEVLGQNFIASQLFGCGDNE